MRSAHWCAVAPTVCVELFYKMMIFFYFLLFYLEIFILQLNTFYKKFRASFYLNDGKILKPDHHQGLGYSLVEKGHITKKTAFFKGQGQTHYQ